jgi:hypothetical protein
MIVFLANHNATKTVIWWSGHDTVNQTSFAYVNRYFTGDDPDVGELTNGLLTLEFNSGFRVDSTVGDETCEATFMRINDEGSVYGSSLAYVITEGVVRDVIHQEAEWSGGAAGCPNLYAHIVLTLPANSTYYTYQLRLMFIESEQSRTITDLCPIKLNVLTGQQQTENGTSNDYPVVSDVTGLFYNQSGASWEHHWSQFSSGTQGGGIMFTDLDNQKLYAFDPIAGDTTGALKVSSGRIIELLPVTMNPVSFDYAYDITWNGAVVTFDDTTPIYKDDGGTKTGLWIIVEHPPIISVTT